MAKSQGNVQADILLSPFLERAHLYLFPLSSPPPPLYLDLNSVAAGLVITARSTFRPAAGALGVG